MVLIGVCCQLPVKERKKRKHKMKTQHIHTTLTGLVWPNSSLLHNADADDRCNKATTTKFTFSKVLINT